MTDLTPRDDVKKTVSEILKRVDQLLKAGSLEEARTHIARAKEVDPKNVYVFAYEERLSFMVEEKARKDAEEAKRKAEAEQQQKEDEARRKKEEEKRKAEEEARKKNEEEQRRKAEEKRRTEEAEKRKKVEEVKPRVQSGAAGGRPMPEVPRSVLEETKRKILEDRKKKGIHPHEIPPPGQFHSAYEEGLEIYRRVLFEAWADGATTAEEKQQLESLQASLMISAEDRSRLEREAKIESYTNAFRRAWSSGAISPESSSSLVELRKKFSINMDEHEQIEASLLWELRSSSQKAQILIIDDDQKLLTVISDTLQDAGFQTIPVATTDEAFKILQKVAPDLILSDINLETSTMGGFSFYEKVREIERLHEIPFIFLSGLTDEVLIRTGKELGVDDYITKPFSNDSLIATIKGKLKRYRQMKKKK